MADFKNLKKSEDCNEILAGLGIKAAVEYCKGKCLGTLLSKKYPIIRLTEIEFIEKSGNFLFVKRAKPGDEKLLSSAGWRAYKAIVDVMPDRATLLAIWWDPYEDEQKMEIYAVGDRQFNPAVDNYYKTQITPLEYVDLKDAWISWAMENRR